MIFFKKVHCRYPHPQKMRLIEQDDEFDFYWLDDVDAVSPATLDSLAYTVADAFATNPIDVALGVTREMQLVQNYKSNVTVYLQYFHSDCFRVPPLLISFYIFIT